LIHSNVEKSVKLANLDNVRNFSEVNKTFKNSRNIYELVWWIRIHFFRDS